MVVIEADSYQVDYFSENSFQRKKCVACGSYFWTLDTNRTTCGDAPCEEYSFFERSYLNKRMDVRSARNEFLGFFVDRGHTLLSPRGVAARWRDDLYLTIASIVLFQPFVTSGEVPPPANPLVVSQPCIRLNDIDNVGLTAGRHMSIFEMGGHHAFNSKEKFIYWKDQTVRYCYEFFTKLGAKPEEITLKESIWTGGGDAGPCFEVEIGGLEVATLVFMEYKMKTETDWVPLPLKIVDTGYGIERISWLSQQTPTAFHAVYGGLVHQFSSKLGVDLPDDELLAAVAKRSALMKVEGGEDVNALRQEVSKLVGVPYNELVAKMAPAESVFALLDHTKTISFMLSDGIVPSNTGEGYLARLMIRRALRLKRKLARLPLSELVSLQVDEWGRDFPNLKAMRDTVLEEVELEEAKFDQNQQKASSGLAALFSRGNITTDDLIKLYDSNGIDPYLVEEEGSKRGVKVEVPSNFYTIVANSHSRAKPKQDRRKEVDVALVHLPQTVKLYYEDPHLFEFNAKVLGLSGTSLVLDRTAFYPEGGGQPADTGEITINGETHAVVDAQQYDGVIVHFLDGPVGAKPGDQALGRIDVERRLRHTQSHDATHILLSSARKVLGNHVWQAGAQKGYYYSRLDVTHYRKLTPSEVVQIEDLANQVVQDDRRISARLMDRNEAERQYGYTLYQGGVVPGAKIRVVEIDGFDVEACGGTHSESTGRVGAIKILEVDQPQDGIVRFVFSAGRSAVEYSRRHTEVLSIISKKLNANTDTLEKKVDELIEEGASLRQKLQRLVKAYAESLLDKCVTAEVNGISVNLLFLEDSIVDPAEVATTISNKGGIPAAVISSGRLVLAVPKPSEYHAAEILRVFSRVIPGKGGGGKYFAELVTETPVTLESFRSFLSNQKT